MAHSLLSTAFAPDLCRAIIAKDATVAESAYLGNNVTIYPKVDIQDGCIIMDGAVLGRPPIVNATVTRAVPKGFLDLLIGAGTIVGCNSVLYTGSHIGKGVLIGDLTSIREGCSIGDEAVIGRGVMLLYNCQVGARSRIQDQTHLVGNMVIEEDVFIGMSVTTTNDNDVYVTRLGRGRAEPNGPLVRRFAVIGAGATLLPGIEIGIGAMVAANALVSRDVPPWTIVGGIPARRMKDVPVEWRSQVESAYDLKGG